MKALHSVPDSRFYTQNDQSRGHFTCLWTNQKHCGHQAHGLVTKSSKLLGPIKTEEGNTKTKRKHKCKHKSGIAFRALFCISHVQSLVRLIDC